MIDDSNPQNLRHISDFKVLPISEIPIHHIHSSPIVPQLTTPHPVDPKVIVKVNEQLSGSHEVDK